MISGKTTLFGLIGYPVSHSFSPAMHNAAIANLGLDCAYVPFPIAPDAIEAGLHGLRAIGVRGVNVTIPHKRAVMPHLDLIDKAAVAIGAVNTILFSDDGMQGYNTDWTGFLADLEAHGVNPHGRTCIVLGAGGSARAIVYALLQAGATVHLLARRPEQAANMRTDFSQIIDTTALHPHPLTALSPITSDPDQAISLIINTTPLGMSPHVDASVWPDDVPIPAGAFVYDLVYTPATTRLMKQAKQAGCPAANGLGMLLYQGAHALTRWTDQEPDLQVMRDALIASQA